MKLYLNQWPALRISRSVGYPTHVHMVASAGDELYGGLPQGHGQVISRSQQGQISSKRLKIPLFLFFAKMIFT